MTEIDNRKGGVAPLSRLLASFFANLLPQADTADEVFPKMHWMYFNEEVEFLCDWLVRFL